MHGEPEGADVKGEPGGNQWKAGKTKCPGCGKRVSVTVQGKLSTHNRAGKGSGLCPMALKPSTEEPSMGSQNVDR